MDKESGKPVYPVEVSDSDSDSDVDLSNLNENKNALLNMLKDMMQAMLPQLNGKPLNTMEDSDESSDITDKSDTEESSEDDKQEPELNKKETAENGVTARTLVECKNCDFKFPGFFTTKLPLHSICFFCHGG